MPKSDWRSKIDRLARILPGLIRGPRAPEVFRRFEAAGVHVTPVHFYQPIPDTRTLPDGLWRNASRLSGIDLNVRTQLRLVREVFPKFRAEYDLLPQAPTGDPGEFHLNNGAFDGTDALAYYCMIRHFRPRTVIEVGAGHSSRLAALAARRNGRTRLVCIEPFPKPFLRGLPGLARLVEKPVQAVGLRSFLNLRRNDILFIDSSHVSRIGSDVNLLFLEVLPRLRPGVLVHVHDIFLPGDYPRDWVLGEHRFWSEQYLLQAFLAFNRGYEVVLANAWLGRRHRALLKKIFPRSAPWWGGGASG